MGSRQPEAQSRSESETPGAARMPRVRGTIPLFTKPLSAMVGIAALIVSAVLTSAAGLAAARSQALPDGADGTAAPQRSDTALPACGQSNAPPLSAIPFRFHEDSSIQTRIDLNALNVEDYASLGVQVAREDGVDYRPWVPPSAWARNCRP